jgi:hypothetical protein
MPSQDARTAFCLDQAKRCAKAASSASAAELKEAYANLRQGWLHLAPPLEAGESPDPAPPSAPSRRRPNWRFR